MTETIGNGRSKFGLERYGIRAANDVYWNLLVHALYEQSILNGEGKIASGGPLVVRTGVHTGRSPKDKFVVRETSSEANVDWGQVNQPFSHEQFDVLYARVTAYLSARKLYVEDMFACADEQYRLPVRIVTEFAWHALFVRNLFIRPIASDLAEFDPEFTILYAPTFEADPARDGTRSKTFIILNFQKRIILIGGTWYAGEMKKSIFTVLNYLLPLKGVFPMHCSANVGDDGTSAIFFGLSGTGKTTLSADATRGLIGDDEHGWSDTGIFNFEGGCYAKVIRLSKASEPEIWDASNRYGTVLENVVMDEGTRRVNFDSDQYTENTRSAYPLSYIKNAVPTGIGPHPRNIIMLTADAFGVLPPISRLTKEQAAYHFLSGYTAKVAGTEKGVTAPEATFSTCFGAPFLVHKAKVYADLLVEKMQKHNVNCWLVNTGWTAGPYGKGYRMRIAYTRDMVHAALDGSLNHVPTRPEQVFGLHIPENIPGVPSDVLIPRETWRNKEEYDAKANELLHRFESNYDHLLKYGTSEGTAGG
jgi:phosphoenolpyruvate carboxykinase (ATP)